MKRTYSLNRLMALLIPAVLTTGMISCFSSDTDNPMGPQTNPQANAIAGTYTAEYRWGGASGLWRAPADMSVQPHGKVLYRGEQIMNPQFGTATVSWAMADGNPHNAAITFQDSDNRDYFWRDKAATRRNFTGWLQFPGEGKLDFRGLSK